MTSCLNDVTYNVPRMQTNPECMAEKQFKKSIVLRPDWRVFFTSFALGILATPLLGLGLILLRRTWLRWKTEYYEISDSEITLHSESGRQTVPLWLIESCTVDREGLTGRFGLQTIALQTASRSFSEPPLMRGLTGAEATARLIEQAADSERQRMAMREQTEREQPTHPSGTLEPMNDLVGLWQQGLISDEDYERERQKFSS